MIPRAAALALLGTTLLTQPVLADATPAVVVTVKPLHSLVAGVMDGVGEPTLLLDDLVSPHSYSLRPSDAAALQDADAVVWVGPSLEVFLADSLQTLAPEAAVLTGMAAPEVRLREVRSGGAWDGHDHGDGHDHDHDHDHDDAHAHDHAHEDDHAHYHADDHAHDHAHDDDHGHEGGSHRADFGGDIDAVDLAALSAYDGHIWLDPMNAIALTDGIAEMLAAIDPAHADRYAANADSLIAEIEALDATLAERLTPVADAPFIVFHDAYGYLEDRYDLTAVGSITVNPAVAPGAARIRDLQDKIAELSAACVFAEPQFRPAIVDTVVEGSGARTGELDPLGSFQPAGRGNYAATLTAMADALVGCLQPSG